MEKAKIAELYDSYAQDIYRLEAKPGGRFLHNNSRQGRVEDGDKGVSHRIGGKRKCILCGRAILVPANSIADRTYFAADFHICDICKFTIFHKFT